MFTNVLKVVIIALYTVIVIAMSHVPFYVVAIAAETLALGLLCLIAIILLDIWRDRKVPLYEFICEECDDKEEGLYPLDTSKVECPKCGKPMRKLISVSTFRLKGGGWFADGYNKKKE